MPAKETLHELTNEMRDIQDEIQILCELDLDTEQMEKSLEILKQKIARKVENIDHVYLSFDIAIARLDNIVAIYENEIKVAKIRKQSMENNQDRLMQYLADLDIVTKDKPLRTGQRTYYLRSSRGKLNVAPEAKIPPEFIKTKIEQVVDNAGLRNAVINGLEVDGINVETTTKVCRR